MLALEPGGADRKRESAMGDLIQGCRHFCGQGRVAISVAQHQMADLQLFSESGDGGRDGDPFVGGQVLLFLPPRGWQVVIGKPDAVPLSSFKTVNRVFNIVPGVSITAHLCSELHMFSLSHQVKRALSRDSTL